MTGYVLVRKGIPTSSLRPILSKHLQIVAAESTGLFTSLFPRRFLFFLSESQNQMDLHHFMKCTETSSSVLMITLACLGCMCVRLERSKPFICSVFLCSLYFSTSGLLTASHRAWREVDNQGMFFALWISLFHTWRNRLDVRLIVCPPSFLFLLS